MAHGWEGAGCEMDGGGSGQVSIDTLHPCRLGISQYYVDFILYQKSDLVSCLRSCCLCLCIKTSSLQVMTLLLMAVDVKHPVAG